MKERAQIGPALYKTVSNWNISCVSLLFAPLHCQHNPIFPKHYSVMSLLTPKDGHIHPHSLLTGYPSRVTNTQVPMQWTQHPTPFTLHSLTLSSYLPTVTARKLKISGCTQRGAVFRNVLWLAGDYVGTSVTSGLHYPWGGATHVGDPANPATLGDSPVRFRV